MTTHTFIIPGKPVRWHQDATVRGNRPHLYLARRPSKSKSPKEHFSDGWRKMAVALIAEQWGGRAPLEGPLRVEAYAVFPRVKADDCPHKRSCSCPPEKKDGRSVWHMKKPDDLNVTKLAEDALPLAGVIPDDCFDQEVFGRKRVAARGEEPHVRIVVELLPEFPDTVSTQRRRP